MKNNASLKVYIPVDLLQGLHAKAAKEDITLSSLTRLLWRDWLAGKIEIGVTHANPSSNQTEVTSRD